MDGWPCQSPCYTPILPGAGPPHRATLPWSGTSDLCFRPSSCPRVGVLSVTTLLSYHLAIFALKRGLLTHHPSSQFSRTETKPIEGSRPVQVSLLTPRAEPVWKPSLETAASVSGQRRSPMEGHLEERLARGSSRCGLHTGALHKLVFPRPGQ